MKIAKMTAAQIADQITLEAGGLGSVHRRNLVAALPVHVAEEKRRAAQREADRRARKEVRR